MRTHFNASFYVPAICILGCKTQLLIVQRMELGLHREAADLRAIDRHLTDLFTKANFNPSEARIPSGQPGGGQWTSVGGSTSSETLMGAEGNDTLKPRVRETNTVMDDAGNITRVPQTEDTKVPESWADPDFEKFDQHYKDHKVDFNSRTPEEYAEEANQFYKEAWEQNYPKLEYPKGSRIAVYDPITNRFGLYTPEEKTVTFYKPKAGINYFKKLIGTQVKRGGRIIIPLPPETLVEPVIEPIEPEIFIP